jgi:hypothetical protein
MSDISDASNIAIGLMAYAGSVCASVSVYLVAAIDLNRTRDKICCGRSEDQKLFYTWKHRRIMLENDWIPMHRGTFWVMFFLSFGNLSGGIIGNYMMSGNKIISLDLVPLMIWGLTIVATVIPSLTAYGLWSTRKKDQDFIIDCLENREISVI